jgi:hypothetical protein
MGSAHPNRYWTLWHLSGDGSITQDLSPQVASQLSAYLAEHHGQILTKLPFPDGDLTQALFAVWQDNRADPQHRIWAEQCLRCRISHIIYAATYGLWDKFGDSTYPFKLDEILKLVLNDCDRRLQPFTPRSPEAPGSFQPLAQKILETYNPQTAALSTWASRLARQNPEVAEFLLEHGIALISDWSLLNNCTVSRLERLLLKTYGIAGANRTNSRSQSVFQAVDQACDLLDQFHRIYTEARKEESRGRCKDPTEEQLAAIAAQLKHGRSPEACQQTLLSLAKILRQDYIRQHGGRLPSDEISYHGAEGLGAMLRGGGGDEASANTPFRLDPDSLMIEGGVDVELQKNTQALHEDLLQALEAAFPQALEQAVAQAIEQRYQEIAGSSHVKTRAKADQEFLVALHCVFCKFQTMTEIAQQLGMKDQYNVTKLLVLKAMRSTVRRLALQSMLLAIKQVLQSFPLETTQDLDQAIAQVDRWMSGLVSDSNSDTDTAGLDSIAQRLDQGLQEEKARMMSAARRPNQYTRAVCNYLAARDPARFCPQQGPCAHD